MIAQTAAGQQSIYQWSRDHRVHHKFSDSDADPYNINRGFFFAHMGWLLRKKHPELILKGKKLDFTDLLRDPVVSFQYRYKKSISIFFAQYFSDFNSTISLLQILLHFIPDFWNNNPNNHSCDFLVGKFNQCNFHQYFPVQFMQSFNLVCKFSCSHVWRASLW